MLIFCILSLITFKWSQAPMFKKKKKKNIKRETIRKKTDFIFPRLMPDISSHFKTVSNLPGQQLIAGMPSWEQEKKK